MCNCRNVTVLKGDKGDTGATGPQGPQGPEGTFGYNVYVASFVQSGAEAPSSVYVLENTLVDTTPTWTRTGAGEYVLTATASFPDFATKLWIDGMSNSLAEGTTAIPILNKSLTITGYYSINAVDIDSVKMTVVNGVGTKVDLSSLVTVSTRIYLPEIRIYP